MRTLGISSNIQDTEHHMYASMSRFKYILYAFEEKKKNVLWRHKHVTLLVVSMEGKR